MSVARFSCPQFPDAALRTTQQPVDVTAVGVGCHLRRDSGGQARERLGQRPVHPVASAATPYSPKYLEAEVFCELPLYGVLRSSLRASNPKQQQRYAVWAMC